MAKRRKKELETSVSDDSDLSNLPPLRAFIPTHNDSLEGFQIIDRTQLDPRTSVESDVSDLSFPSHEPSLLDHLRTSLAKGADINTILNKKKNRRDMTINFSLSSSPGSLNSSANVTLPRGRHQANVLARKKKSNITMNFTLNDTASSCDNQENESPVLPSNKPVFKKPFTKKMSISIDDDSDSSKYSIHDDSLPTLDTMNGKPPLKSSLRSRAASDKNMTFDISQDSSVGSDESMEQVPANEQDLLSSSPNNNKNDLSSLKNSVSPSIEAISLDSLKESPVRINYLTPNVKNEANKPKFDDPSTAVSNYSVAPSDNPIQITDQTFTCDGNNDGNNDHELDSSAEFVPTVSSNERRLVNEQTFLTTGNVSGISCDRFSVNKSFTNSPTDTKVPINDNTFVVEPATPQESVHQSAQLGTPRTKKTPMRVDGNGESDSLALNASILNPVIPGRGTTVSGRTSVRPLFKESGVDDTPLTSKRRCPDSTYDGTDTVAHLDNTNVQSQHERNLSTSVNHSPSSKLGGGPSKMQHSNKLKAGKTRFSIDFTLSDTTCTDSTITSKILERPPEPLLKKKSNKISIPIQLGEESVDDTLPSTTHADDQELTCNMDEDLDYGDSSPVPSPGTNNTDISSPVILGKRTEPLMKRLRSNKISIPYRCDDTVTDGGSPNICISYDQIQVSETQSTNVEDVDAKENGGGNTSSLLPSGKCLNPLAKRRLGRNKVSIPFKLDDTIIVSESSNVGKSDDDIVYGVVDACEHSENGCSRENADASLSNPKDYTKEVANSEIAVPDSTSNVTQLSDGISLEFSLDGMPRSSNDYSSDSLKSCRNISVQQKTSNISKEIIPSMEGTPAVAFSPESELHLELSLDESLLYSGMDSPATSIKSKSDSEAKHTNSSVEIDGAEAAKDVCCLDSSHVSQVSSVHRVKSHYPLRRSMRKSKNVTVDSASFQASVSDLSGLLKKSYKNPLKPKSRLSKISIALADETSESSIESQMDTSAFCGRLTHEQIESTPKGRLTTSTTKEVEVNNDISTEAPHSREGPQDQGDLRIHDDASLTLLTMQESIGETAKNVDPGEISSKSLSASRSNFLSGDSFIDNNLCVSDHRSTSAIADPPSSPRTQKKCDDPLVPGNTMTDSIVTQEDEQTKERTRTIEIKQSTHDMLTSEKKDETNTANYPDPAAKNAFTSDATEKFLTLPTTNQNYLQVHDGASVAVPTLQVFIGETMKNIDTGEKSSESPSKSRSNCLFGKMVVNKDFNVSEHRNTSPIAEVPLAPTTQKDDDDLLVQDITMPDALVMQDTSRPSEKLDESNTENHPNPGAQDSITSVATSRILPLPTNVSNFGSGIPSDKPSFSKDTKFPTSYQHNSDDVNAGVLSVVTGITPNIVEDASKSNGLLGNGPSIDPLRSSIDPPMVTSNIRKPSPSIERSPVLGDQEPYALDANHHTVTSIELVHHPTVVSPVVPIPNEPESVSPPEKHDSYCGIDDGKVEDNASYFPSTTQTNSLRLHLTTFNTEACDDTNIKSRCSVAHLSHAQEVVLPLKPTVSNNCSGAAGLDIMKEPTETLISPTNKPASNSVSSLPRGHNVESLEGNGEQSDEPAHDVIKIVTVEEPKIDITCQPRQEVTSLSAEHWSKQGMSSNSLCQQTVYHNTLTSGKLVSLCDAPMSDDKNNMDGLISNSSVPKTASEIVEQMAQVEPMNKNEPKPCVSIIKAGPSGVKYDQSEPEVPQKFNRKSVSFKPPTEYLYHSPPGHVLLQHQDQNTDGRIQDDNGYEFSRIQMTTDISGIEPASSDKRAKRHFSSTPISKPRKPTSTAEILGHPQLLTNSQTTKHQFLVPPIIPITKRVSIQPVPEIINNMIPDPQCKPGAVATGVQGSTESGSGTSGYDLSSENSLEISAIPKDMSASKWGGNAPLFHSTPLHRTRASMKQFRKKSGPPSPMPESPKPGEHTEGRLVNHSVQTSHNLRSRSQTSLETGSTSEPLSQSTSGSLRSSARKKPTPTAITPQTPQSSGDKLGADELVIGSPANRIAIQDNTILSTRIESQSRTRGSRTRSTTGSTFKSYDSHRKTSSRRLFTNLDENKSSTDAGYPSEESNSPPPASAPLTSNDVGSTSWLDDGVLSSPAESSVVQSHPPSIAQTDGNISAVSGQQHEDYSDNESIISGVSTESSSSAPIDNGVVMRQSFESQLSSIRYHSKRHGRERAKSQHQVELPKPRSKYAIRRQNPTSDLDHIFPVDVPLRKRKRTQSAAAKLFNPGAKWKKSKQLYAWLKKKLEPEYKLHTNLESERLVIELDRARILVSQGHKDNALDLCVERLVRLKICSNQLQLWGFFMKFMPYDFIREVVPMGGAFGKPFGKDHSLMPYDPISFPSV